MAKRIIGTESIGRTDKWILDKIGWSDYSELFISSIQKTVHHILNVENDHYFKTELLQNRKIRNFSENKLGPQKTNFGFTKLELSSFFYLSVKYYNILPKKLTLLKKHINFKRALKKFKLGKELIIKKSEDKKENFYSSQIRS